jgi:prolyl oligopeptidase
MIPTRKDDIVEDFHGTLVADPYRWLEDAESAEVQEWTQAQNDMTRAFLDRIPERQQIRARLEQLWDYPKQSIPTRHGGRYFFALNSGLQNQAILYMQPSLDAEPVELLDPNTLSEDGTIATTRQSFTKDGSRMAYAIAESGSDWQTIRVRDVETQQDLSDVVRWCKFTSIAWKPDGSGFFYSRYPEPGSVAPEDESHYSRVYFHLIGSAQEDDTLIYERPDFKELLLDPDVTEDGKYLVITASVGTDPRTRIYYRELDSDAGFIPLLDKGDAKYWLIDNDGPVFYIQTDHDAPRGKLVAIDTQQPGEDHWHEVIPEGGTPLDFVVAAGEHFVVAMLIDAQHKVDLYHRDGTFDRQIVLPTIGAVEAISGKPGDPELFLGFTSFLYPSTPFRYDLNDPNATLEPLHESGIDFDPSGYETKQVFVHSTDGTRVPMFVVHKKDLHLHGDNPTLLYGYGGFNISLTPSFSIHRLVWLEMGGVFALANLRGGEEYGEEWHRAGMLENKQNVFEDFISAAEWLIANGYTNQKKLAINGGSNGGLLVAACLTQRPDLYGAAVCEVPVIDMLRYHRFTIGHFWVPEYGNAEDDPEHFRFMYAYSPLHNVRPDTVYPPTLILSADTDDRVVPAHAKKFTATLQEAHVGDAPILLRIEMKAGHGLGKPTSKILDERADVYAFLYRELRMGDSG